MRYSTRGLYIAAMILASASFMVWSGCLDKDKDERELEARIIHSAPVVDLSFSPDGMVLASASQDDTVRLLDVAQLHQNFELGSESNVVPEELPMSPLVGHGYGFTAVDFSPLGSNLAAAFTDVVAGDVIRVWNLLTGERIAQLDGLSGPVEALAYGMDPATLASGGGYRYNAGDMYLWDLGEGGSPMDLGEGLGPVHDVEFSPDGRMLATAWDDGVIRIWDTQTWEPIYTLSTGDHVPHALAFYPYGNYLASAGDDSGPGFDGHGGVVRIWDLDDGTLDSAYDMGILPIHALQYSPDGSLLAIGGEEHRIHIVYSWNGTTAFTLRGHTNTVNDVEFSVNGQILASCSDDWFIRFWYVGDVVGHTCDDGIDNDWDGWVDEDDPDCANGDRESGFGETACNDNADNDDDGYIDSADPGCEDGFDDSEQDDEADAGPDAGEPDGGEPDAGGDPDAGTEPDAGGSPDGGK